jgi:hypothetical protein
VPTLADDHDAPPPACNPDACNPDACHFARVQHFLPILATIADSMNHQYSAQSCISPMEGDKMSMAPSESASVAAPVPTQTGTSVSASGGTLSVNEASMKATVKAVLETANEIGGFWTRWGVSASLFTIGTFAIIIAFIAHAVDTKLWDDNSFFGALAFALAILVLGFVAFADKQNRSGQTGEQAVRIYDTTVKASLEGQRIAAQERTAALPTPVPGPPGGGLSG